MSRVALRRASVTNPSRDGIGVVESEHDLYPCTICIRVRFESVYDAQARAKTHAGSLAARSTGPVGKPGGSVGKPDGPAEQHLYPIFQTKQPVAEMTQKY